MFDRSDGLLRGSRGKRIAEILSLKKAEWNLDTALGLQSGFLDHAEEVRLAAVEALKAIAQALPEPILLTPLELLTQYMFDFTARSGAAPEIFEFLVQLDTAEAARLVEEALKRVRRNEDFKSFVEILMRAKKLDILERLQETQLSKPRATILHGVLNRA